VVAAFATAAARPNSSLAFGILAPLWGQGLAGLWGARHGAFPPRPAAGPRVAGRPAQPGPAEPPGTTADGPGGPADPPPS